MSGLYRLHRRRFWIGPAAEAPSLPHWITRPLAGGRVLTYDPDLAVSAAPGPQGTWYLLGVAIQTDPTRPGPAVELAAAAARGAAPEMATWVGRWVVLGSTALHTDAAALLSCHLRPAAGGGVCVSSSPALLVAPMAPSVSAAAHPSITHAVGFDFYPMPGARHTALTRLLPSQVLSLADGSMSARPLCDLPPDPPPYAVVVDALEAYLTAAIRRAATTTDGTVWVTLTAGIDSRLVFAAAGRSGVPIRAVTSHYPMMNDADRLLPPRLAAAMGVPHHVRDGGAVDPARARLFDAHTGGQVADYNRLFFSRGDFDGYASGDLTLSGVVFEVGRAYYWPRLPATVPSHVPASADVIATAFHGPRAPRRARRSARGWPGLARRHSLGSTGGTACSWNSGWRGGSRRRGRGSTSRIIRGSPSRTRAPTLAWCYRCRPSSGSGHSTTAISSRGWRQRWRRSPTTRARRCTSR